MTGMLMTQLRIVSQAGMVRFDFGPGFKPDFPVSKSLTRGVSELLELGWDFRNALEDYSDCEDGVVLDGTCFEHSVLVRAIQWIDLELLGRVQQAAIEAVASAVVQDDLILMEACSYLSLRESLEHATGNVYGAAVRLAANPRPEEDRR